MNVRTLESVINTINDIAWGRPLITFIVLVGIFATLMLKFVQVRYFTTAWRMVLAPRERTKAVAATMSPFQAFLNALSASIGNGSLSGMATALYSGGPGAAFWVLVMGFFGLALRFSEVYLSTAESQLSSSGDGSLGGPMIYLRRVPGRSFLPFTYALFCLLLSLFSGNAMQCNSIRIGAEKMLNIDARIIAIVLFSFVLYIMLGGAQRIIKVSDTIVPFKVGFFFVSAFLVLAYHWHALIPAFKLMLVGAFTPQALAGGVLGYTIQDAIRFGMARSANATEAGLGTAGVLFGSTGGENPVRNGIISMVATFISYYLVCFIIMLCIIASGVWNTGLTSTALTISAFQTVYGTWGSWIVTGLSVIFGIGVLVAYAYIGRECWRFLTNGRWLGAYSALYCATALYGALAHSTVVWNAIDIVNAGLMAINLYAIVYLMPTIVKGLRAFERA